MAQTEEAQTDLTSAVTEATQKHIVDILIEERAPKISQGPLWRYVRPPLYTALHYKQARKMADDIAPMSGHHAMEYISELLRLKVIIRGLNRVPRDGRIVVVANHPTGIADGVAVYDGLKTIRPDVCFFANADAHRVCPSFIDCLIPVEWVLDKRSHEKTKLTLRMASQAFKDERALMIFPAGRLARRFDGVIQDPTWEASAVSLARKNKAPVIPINVKGPYPIYFHGFDRVSKELRDITLFHELLNKTGQTYTLTVGPPIPHEALSGDSAEMSQRLKIYVERELGNNRDAAFEPARYAGD
ncbi:MAG: 1-acyl-sn-glycerol-3-phosphate acyltransferase [Caulobacterales bacterium]